MAKIYGGVKGINKPAITSDWQGYEKRAEVYVQKIKDYAKQNSKCSEAGKEIHFPVADGRACYVVLSLRPLELVHLDVNDGYSFQYANRLTATDVRAEIKRNEALTRLFKKVKICGGQ